MIFEESTVELSTPSGMIIAHVSKPVAAGCRPAIVLFSDMRNFSGIAECLLPLQSVQMLNRLVTGVCVVIVSDGGVVD